MIENVEHHTEPIPDIDTEIAELDAEIDELGQHPAASLRRQPLAVWATAFAAVVAFMGIGLVDPILPSIASNLHASPSQVSLLFTSYFLVTAVAMLLTGWVSSRIGGRRTLLAGLAIVVVFAAASGTSDTVAQLVGWRAGWGLGNAMFVATALAVIVGAASGGGAAAILLYEAALGLGISMGPLLGAVLGGWQWRLPFFGTATLMAVGFVAVALLLKDGRGGASSDGTPAEPAPPAPRISLLDPLRALRHGGLATTAGSAFFYNVAFFTILAFTPFVLHMSAYGIGGVFFGWGVSLALTSVLLAPRLQERFGSVRVLTWSLALLGADLFAIAYAPHVLMIVLVIVSGCFLGVNNTIYTELAMEVSNQVRSVASAGYNFVRWLAAAITPYLATKLAEKVNAHVPYLVGGASALLAVAVLVACRRHLRHV